MSDRIFAVGRARSAKKAKAAQSATVRPAASLAAAARRPGPARRVPSAQSQPPAPTLTSLTVATGWMSRRRLAGVNGAPADPDQASVTAAPVYRPTEIDPNDRRAPTAVDPADMWARAVSHPAPQVLDQPPRSHGGGGRHAAPAEPPDESVATASPSQPASSTPPTAGAEHNAIASGHSDIGTEPSGTVPRDGRAKAAAVPPHALRRVVDPAGGQRGPSRTGAPKSPPAQPRSRSRTRSTTAATKSKRPHRGRRVLGWTLLSAGVLLLAGTAWVGWRTYQAYNHLQAASQDVAQLQDELRDITTADPTLTAGTVGNLQAEAASARSAVDDPLYRAATGLPLVGPNLDAIREVTLTVDSLATDVMPSLVEIARTLQPSELAPQDGVIDLAPIERISPLLQSADVAVNDARSTLAAIDRSALVEPVGDAVGTLSDKLDAAADVTGPGARTARLLPPMLGSEDVRQYLVVFQNPSELRATGGIFGSFALLRVDAGKISIVDQGASSRNLGFFDPPVAELSEQELALYGPLMAQFPQDANFTPDYPTAAALFQEMYRVRTGTTTDGVLAIDPVALSYTLEGSPGVDIGGGETLTSENLVSTLLSTAYERFEGVDQEERDSYLDNATGKVFSEVMSGSGDPRAIINGLRRAADERRVLVFSSRPEEQADIAKTGLAGSLDTESERPTIGIFMNDGTGAKLDYYLKNEAHVTEGECGPDGRREMQVRVVMNFDAPADGLPDYVSGARQPGEPYLLRTNVLAFAPVGGGVVEAVRDGQPLPIGRGTDHGREVGTATIELLPGQSTELIFTVVGPAGAIGGPDDVPPTLMLTPGVNPWVTSVGELQDCSAALG